MEDRDEPPNEVMTVDELAARLRVTRGSIYGLVQRRKIPGVIHLGRSIRISRAAIEKWLTEGDARLGRPKTSP